MVGKITFKISQDGEVNLSVEGVKGSSCQNLSRPFEEVIGNLSARALKDSYYANTEELPTQNQEEAYE